MGEIRQKNEIVISTESDYFHCFTSETKKKPCLYPFGSINTMLFYTAPPLLTQHYNKEDPGVALLLFKKKELSGQQQ